MDKCEAKPAPHGSPAVSMGSPHRCGVGCSQAGRASEGVWRVSVRGSPVASVRVAQSCPTLSDPMDCIVHGILPARILEWVAIPFSRDLSDPGVELRSPRLQVDSLPTEL